MNSCTPPRVRGSAPRRLLAAALGAGLLALAWPAQAIDLLQAYQAALEHDATLRAARAAADAARERLPQARAQLLPNVYVNLIRNVNDQERTQEGLGTTNEKFYSYNQSLMLRQPLFRKPLFDGLSQAAFIVLDADATLEREAQNLGVRLTGAYLEVLLAQDQLDLVLAQQATTTMQLDAARKALAAGAGTRTDIDEAQARLDLNRADELEARQHLDYTRRLLQVLTNQPTGELAGVDAERLPLLPPQPASLEDWLAQAETNSPEIQALKARLEAARLEVDKARGAHYPTLDAVAQVTRSGSENPTNPASSYTNHLLGLQLNIPLFAGGGVESTVRQAAAERVRAEETLEAARRDLGMRLYREYRGVTEGVLRVQALTQAVRSSEQLVTSNRRAFAAGSRTMVDILDAEQKLQSTRRDLAEARYLYLVSRVRLHALAGSDKEHSIAEVNAWLRQP